MGLIIGQGSKSSGGNKFYQCPVIQIEGNAATISPNILYVFGIVDSLELTLEEPTDTTIANEYMIQFYCGNVETNIVINGDIDTIQGVVTKNALNEISIMNKKGFIA